MLCKVGALAELTSGKFEIGVKIMELIVESIYENVVYKIATTYGINISRANNGEPRRVSLRLSQLKR